MDSKIRCDSWTTGKHKTPESNKSDSVYGSPRHVGWYRTHAHDQETAVGDRGGRRGAHCSRLVRLPRRLIPASTGTTAPASSPEHNWRQSRSTTLPHACPD